MSTTYTVRPGDTLTKIARDHGFANWRTIYNAPENASFRAKRPNPDRIFPGDVIVIPDNPAATPPPPLIRHQAGVIHCDELYPGAVANPSLLSRPAAFRGGEARAMTFSWPWQRTPTGPSPKAEALALAPLAHLRVTAAGTALSVLRSTLQLDGDLSSMEEWKAASINFKVDAIAAKDARLARIDLLSRKFQALGQVFLHPGQHFDEDLTNLGDYANATEGGIDRPGSKIRFCPKFLFPFAAPDVATPSGPLFRIGVIIHEAAHFSNAMIGHVASELPALDGSPVTTANPFGTGHNYNTMTADEAWRNAYSYAQFCLHIYKGQDYRLRTFAE